LGDGDRVLTKRWILEIEFVAIDYPVSLPSSPALGVLTVKRLFGFTPGIIECLCSIPSSSDSRLSTSSSMTPQVLLII
jgi:hypothetical protein